MNNPETSQPETNPFREDLREYVAELQLHMTLQAKNLVPSFPEGENTSNATVDSRVQLLRETQADMEKLFSRQEIVSCRL
ncbi:MAG: hypothetical protein AB4290_25660 [Spirulina sp.]